MAHVFFDLDGTLTDSAEGITRCLAHAVRELGGEPPPLRELTQWIGTALPDIFAALLASDDAGTIERAIALYVERFDRVGIRENRLFPDVEPGLGRLQAAGHVLHVATAKTQATAEDVIALFELGAYFRAIHGTPRAHGADKGEMLERVLAEHPIDPGSCFMVGDRHHDVSAARRSGMQSVWVEWGYGTAGERERACPQHVVSAFEELVALIVPAAPRRRGPSPGDAPRGER